MSYCKSNIAIFKVNIAILDGNITILKGYITIFSYKHIAINKDCKVHIAISLLQSIVIISMQSFTY